jgi:hypothetical protein
MSDEAAQLFAALRREEQAGTIRLELDLKRLSHIDSPVAIEAESNRWVYGGIVASGVVWWQLGAAAGIAVATASLGAYLTLGKRQLGRRIAGRVQDKALADIAVWRQLWRFGGVTLVAGERRCAAPAGNWMQLVRELSPDEPPAAPDRGTPVPGA